MAARHISEEEFIKLMGEMKMTYPSRTVTHLKDGERGGELIGGLIVRTGEVSSLKFGHILIFRLETNYFDDEGVHTGENGGPVVSINMPELVIFDANGRDIGYRAVKWHINRVMLPDMMKVMFEPLTKAERKSLAMLTR
ncbi:MAG: hypothetical protein EOO38_15560 [Cytophagaceae bacterium]|nr:MAG: hypothetical protein EOO38_15560 [Cytophagaceae bacterium]